MLLTAGIARDEGLHGGDCALVSVLMPIEY